MVVCYMSTLISCIAPSYDTGCYCATAISPWMPTDKGNDRNREQLLTNRPNSPQVATAVPRKKGLHKAKDDILESIEEARYYRSTIFQVARP